MKKYLLSLVLLGTLSASALAFPQTRTTFYTEGPMVFQVFVDGQSVNYRPDHTVSMDWLSPGRHRLRIVADGRRGNRQVYTGNFHIRPRHHTKFLVRGNRGMGVTVQLTQELPLRGPGQGYGGGNACGHGCAPGQCGHGGQGDYYGGGNWIMDRQQVRQIARSMDYQPFDQDKYRVVRRALGNNRKQILVSDLRTLLDRFAYDRHRLELAKFAYDKVADPENYFMVYDTFMFTSSHQELDQYLGNTYHYYYRRPGGRSAAPGRNQPTTVRPGRRPGGRSQ